MDSEYESYKISDRTRRSAAEMAAAGLPTGRCPWGYVPVHDTRTGKLITWEPDPDRAPLIAELFTRIAAGHSLRGITADWKARGIMTVSDRPFTPQGLRKLAIRAAYAGLRVHHGTTTPGTWDAIVPIEVWHTVQGILSDPARRHSRSGRAVHELTMIIRCGVCGGPMIINNIHGLMYRCREQRCVSIMQAPLDEHVIGAMLGYLSRDDVYDALHAGAQEGPELADIRQRLAAARSELSEAEQTAPETVAEARAFAKLTETLTGKVRELEDQERELTTPSALLRLIQPGADVGQRWAELPISAKRDVARILLSPEILGEVRIKRAGKSGRKAPNVADRIEWHRATATPAA